MKTQLHSVPAESPRVVGYVRVSTSREEMISPELQAQAIKDYCARRGYILADIIEDLDATGRNFARKGVQQAIEMVENAGVAAVVVWKYSRFGRNRKGWAVNLDRVESVGGRLESATEEVDTSTSTGRFTRGMLAEVAAWESDRIGESWQEAHANRHRAGLPHDGKNRFGYTYHRGTVGEAVCPQGCGPGECTTGYVADPETAQVLAEMYSRYNAGESVLKLAVWLNGRGLYSTTGKPWAQRSVRRYMDTGFAAGLLRVHDNECRCSTPMSCDSKSLIPGAQASVISAEEWETYLQQRKKRRRLPPRVETAVYPLAGLVFCGRCDGPMNARPGRKNKKAPLTNGYMYSCAEYQRNRGCAGTWVTRAKVEAHVLDWLTQDAAAELEQLATSSVVRTAEKATREVDVTRLLREQQKLIDALTRLTVHHATGLVPDVAYRPARDQLLASKAEVEEALERLKEEDEAVALPPVEVVEGLVAEWPTLPVGVRRSMLARLVRRIVVTSEGNGKAEIEVIPVWGN